MEITDTTDFVCLLSRILLTLSKSNIREWMVILERHVNHRPYFDMRPIVTAIQEFTDMYPGLDIEQLSRSPTKLVIGNSGCKMKRHESWWDDCFQIHFY